ncbi:hypothetical protein [Clostridium cadaveris]|uniref:hypothetical protein n=1 Tax=Clostridium cadaveris TaxID=1529 RepID=UPI003993C692
MDLKKMVEDAEIFTGLYNDLTNLIDEYLEKYDAYKLKYSSKKYDWISSIIDEFKEVYERHGFEVKEKKKCYDMAYGENCYLEYKAKLQNLEFELIGSGEKRTDKSIRFLQTKPESATFNYELYTDIEPYRIDFNIYEKSKYREKKLNIFNIDQIKDIKENIKNSKYSVDEMKELLSIFKEEKVKLEHCKEEIDDNEFKGYIFNKSKRIYFNSLEELIEVL